MRKDFQVKKMFQRIAFSYDFQNSVLSLGRDIYWRKVLAETVHVEEGDLVLDMATGTAEVAIEICKRHRKVLVAGLDISPNMLAIGWRKVRDRGLHERIHLSIGDARSLPLKSASFGAVTMAFGIRNIAERQWALSEFRRVLKPGGQLLIMEFDYPDDPVLGRLYRWYFDWVLPPFGNWLSSTKDAYTYLVDSVRSFPRQEEFLREIGKAGFNHLEIRILTYGIAKIYIGVKPRTPPPVSNPPSAEERKQWGQGREKADNG